MFYDPLAIALAVISANIPDFDHEFKRNHVLTIIALGALISLFLYFLGLPYYLGIVIILLGGMFLVSSHRGFTHSLLALLLFTGIIYGIAAMIGSGIGYWIAIGFGMGYASHILLDSFNPKGVPLFFPIKHKFSFGKIVTGGWAAKMVFIICLVSTALFEMILLGIRLG